MQLYFRNGFPFEKVKPKFSSCRADEINCFNDLLKVLDKDILLFYAITANRISIAKAFVLIRKTVFESLLFIFRTLRVTQFQSRIYY